MRRLKWIILFVFTIIFLTGVRFYTLPEPVKQRYALSGLCNRYFTETPSAEKSVKSLLYEGFFTPVKHFDANETDLLLTILNDSNSYLDGELATVQFTKYLYFLDKHNNVTILTLIGQDGQTQSFPFDTSIRKYGLLNNESETKFLEIIKN